MSAKKELEDGGEKGRDYSPLHRLYARERAGRGSPFGYRPKDTGRKCSPRQNDDRL